MTVLKVGRFGIDLAPGEIQSVSEDGDRLSISGRTIQTPAEVEYLRQQLRGYVSSSDEAFIPVLWDEQPEIDGYYRVTSATFDGEAGLASEGVWDFSIEMVRMLGYAAPVIELRTVGAYRANTHGVSSSGARQLVGVPQGVRSAGFMAEDIGAWIPFDYAALRVGEDGGVKAYRLSAAFRYMSQFYCPPESHYVGASRLMMGTPNLRTHVGRQVRNDVPWKISNGLIELELIVGAEFQFRMRAYVSGSWRPYVNFYIVGSDTLGGTGRARMLSPHSVTVLRNSPDEVIVRLLTTTSNGSGSADEYGPVTIDISLKRGARWFGFDLHAVYGSRFGVECSQFAGATLTTVSLRAPFYLKTALVTSTSMGMTGPQDITQTGNYVYPNESGVSNVNDWEWMMSLNTSPAPVGDETVSSVEEYFFASSQQQSVAAQ